jgi:hypothetical protein
LLGLGVGQATSTCPFPKLQPRGAGAGLGPSMQTLGARSAQPWAQTRSLGCNPRASGFAAREPGCADPRAWGLQPASLRSADPRGKGHLTLELPSQGVGAGLDAWPRPQEADT